MPSLPDPAFLEARLRRSGLSRLAARRMAGEWLDHLEDLADAGRAAGLSDNAALEEALARLGSATRLIEFAAALPHVDRAVLAREHAAIAMRWSGAGLAGLCLTAGMFAVISAAVGV